MRSKTTKLFFSFSFFFKRCKNEDEARRELVPVGTRKNWHFVSIDSHFKLDSLSAVTVAHCKTRMEKIFPHT